MGKFPRGVWGKPGEKGTNPPGSLRAIIHKVEITIETSLVLLAKLDEIVKEFFDNDLGEVKRKETQCKIYRAISYSRKRGDTIVFYIYSEKLEIRAYTHSLDKAKRLAALSERVKRVLVELYIRYHEKSERVVDNILDAILRKYGKSQSIKYHMHKEKKITYLNRVNKFEYNGLTLIIKTYRHRAYSALKPSDPEYHPKLEVSVILRDIPRGELLSIESKLAAVSRLLNTIRLLAKMKLLLSEYDKSQDYIPLSGVDHELYTILRGTLKRVKAINVLGKEYYDINHAILDLLKRGYKIREIARVLGYDHKAILYRINTLIEKGVVEKVGRGKYIVKQAEKPEKPVVVKYGTLAQYIDLVRTGKLKLGSTIYVEEHEDVIVKYIFSVSVTRISHNKVMIADSREPTKYAILTLPHPPTQAQGEATWLN